MDLLSYGIAAACRAGGSHPGRVATACEECGFDLLLFPEHSHVPQGPALRRPSGLPVGRGYIDLFDSIVSTALALAATKHLRAGPGVAVLSQRDPIYFAKEIASLDVLSDGRVVVGVGAGWNPDELWHHGVPIDERMAVLEAKLRLVRGLLSEDDSILRSLERIPVQSHVSEVFGPRVVQQPCPPFLLGGESQTSAELAARHGLRWMPSCIDRQQLLARIKNVREGAYGEAARALRITVYGATPDEALLEEFASLDVDQVIFRVDDGPGSGALWEIDSVAQRLGRAA